jgi:hypothetical protein
MRYPAEPRTVDEIVAVMGERRPPNLSGQIERIAVDALPLPR